MRKTVTAIMALLVAASLTVKSEVLTSPSFESDVNLANRVNLPPMTQAVLTYLDLPNGEWSVNADANIFVYGNDDMLVHYGAFLGFQPIVDQNDARVAIGSVTTSDYRIDHTIALVGRRIQVSTPVNTTKRVYLTVYIWTDSGSGIVSSAMYGFAYAVRVAP